MRRGCKTPSGNEFGFRSCGQKQKTSVFAIGFAETPRISRITPPTPVLAPPNGSTADGWLCVSALNDISNSSSKSMMPALSTNAEITQGALILSVADFKYVRMRLSIDSIFDNGDSAFKYRTSIFAL